MGRRKGGVTESERLKEQGLQKISVILPESMVQGLDELATLSNRTRSEVVRALIVMAVEESENK